MAPVLIELLPKRTASEPRYEKPNDIVNKYLRPEHPVVPNVSNLRENNICFSNYLIKRYMSQNPGRDCVGSTSVLRMDECDIHCKVLKE